MTLKNKKILMIIGGGIAAYKSLDLIRILKKKNVEIKTILTKSGKEFVTPLSLTTLTRSKTYEDIFDQNSEAEIDHITLSSEALSNLYSFLILSIVVFDLTLSSSNIFLTVLFASNFFFASLLSRVLKLKDAGLNNNDFPEKNII